MSYLFSESRLLTSTPPPSSTNPTTARAHITASLLSMGFPLSRVQPLVSLLNPTQPNAIEVALELLTRDDDEGDGDDEDDEGDPLDDSLHLLGLRHRPRLPPPPDDDDASDAVAVLRIMTGCTAEEAAFALQREADINAAAEWILQRQEQKDASPAPLNSAEPLVEERRREERRLQRRQRRREKAAEYRKVEEEGGEGGKRFFHFGDVLLVQHAQSEEMLCVDSDANCVALQAYNVTPAFSSPSTSSRASNAITSPLTLPKAHSYHTPKGSSLPASAIPPSLSLSSSASPPSAASRSLLSSSPPKKRASIPGSAGSSSAFFPSPSTSLHGGPPTAALPLHPLSPSSSLSGDRATFPSLSLSPLRSPGKPRSFSIPRKSSHPLSLSLPSHHRYHLVIRRAPQSPLTAFTPGEESSESDDEAGLVLSGDAVVLETYERCYLCVEADGSVGCNRTAPLTQQMHFTLRLEEKAEAPADEGDDDGGDIRALEPNAVVSLSTVDHHYLGVESQRAVAKHTQAALSQHFILALAHRAATPHHRRHRSSAASSASVAVSAAAAAPAPTAASLHWAFLRANFRLLAMSLLQAAIAEKRAVLLAKQRAARLRREDAQRLCAVCLDRVCEVVLLECGHSCACEECAQGLKECVVCRQKVQRVVVIRAA